VSCRANTQPAFGLYLSGRDQPGAEAAGPVGLTVLTLSGHRIRGITRFLDAGLPGVFGLDHGLETGALLDPGRNGRAELDRAPHRAQPVMGHADRVG
jgi:hypothetical protein